MEKLFKIQMQPLRSQLFTKLRNGILIGLGIFATLAILFEIGLFATWHEKLSDTLYTQQQPPNDIVIIAIDDTSISEIGRFPWDRNVYAKLLEQLNSTHPPRVIGFDISFLENSDIENDAALAKSISDLKNTKVVLAAEMSDSRFLEPIPQLKDVTFNGYVNTISDSDGITRRVNLWEGGINSFSQQIASTYLSEVQEEKTTRINYLGNPGTFSTYSFIDVLNGEIDNSNFANKIVLIGATAEDLHDTQSVPTSAKMSGVEIQANIIQTLLDQSGKKSEANILTLVTIFMVSVVGSIIFVLLSPLMILIATFGFVIFYILYVIFSFDSGVIRNIIYPILAAVFVAVANVIYKYLTENAEKKFIRKAFSFYLSESVLNHLLENPHKIKLGGERKRLTVLFSDIAGFTSISESMQAHQLAELLNNYLTKMTEIVFKNEGVLDKYIGDAVMAFWGAPVENKDHALAACKTALEMQKTISENFDFTARVGINTGEMVVGNMGSDQRFDYSLLGDNVNLGSRLEGINKQYGTKICISQSTYDEVKDKVAVRKLDTVAVKGKKTGVPIYELLHMGRPTKDEIGFLDVFEKARKLYEKGEFAKALAVFKNVTKDYPNDQATLIYIERIKELIKNPPDHWDGVYHATSK